MQNKPYDTKIICLYGGPGTGKTTCATTLFSILKNKGLDCEYVKEYVKQWAWENRKPVDFDQFYFFGKQSRDEYTLFGKVKYVITDSPLGICSYYTKIYGTKEQREVFNLMTKCYFDMAKNKGFEHIHFWLNRVKPYNPAGRYQTESEASNIDSQMKDYLINELGISFTEVNGNEEGVQQIVELI